MNSKRSPLKGILVVWSVPAAALVVLLLFAGCKEEQPATQQSSSQTQMKQDSVHASQTAANQATATTAAIEQKTCPVMAGNPINPNIFVEYKGKKVYFCCKACPEKFLADPEKYIAKLPQFKQ